MLSNASRSCHSLHATYDKTASTCASKIWDASKHPQDVATHHGDVERPKHLLNEMLAVEQHVQTCKRVTEERNRPIQVDQDKALPDGKGFRKAVERKHKPHRLFSPCTHLFLPSCTHLFAIHRLWRSLLVLLPFLLPAEVQLLHLLYQITAMCGPISFDSDLGW